MNKLVKTILTTAMAAMIIVPGAYAAEDTTKTDNINQKAIVKEEKGYRAIHRQTYIQLLSDKYTPEKSQEWENVFEEREELRFEIKDIKNSPELQDKKEEIKEKRQEIKSEYKEYITELKEKVKNGEMTKEELKEEVEKLKEEIKENKYYEYKEEVKEKRDTYRENRKNAFKELTKGIESEDNDKIEQSLNKLLDLEKQRNEYLKTKIEKIKERINVLESQDM